MNIAKRIRLLEETAHDPGWPDLSVNLVVTDGRKIPDPEPDRLAFIIKAGTPQKRGKVFHRMPDESEEDFIERSRQ